MKVSSLLFSALILLSACNNTNLANEQDPTLNQIPKEEISPISVAMLNTTRPQTTSTNSTNSMGNTPASPQNYTVQQHQLKTVLNRYLQQLETLNTEGIIEMTYPKLFVPINKKLFIHYLNTLLNSPEIHVDAFHTRLISLGKIRPYRGGYFSSITYAREIHLSFLNPDLYNDELSVRVLYDVLSRKYGKANVHIDTQNRTIIIREKERLLAIKEGKKEWKFIGDNPSYRKLYPRIIPADILSKI